MSYCATIYWMHVHPILRLTFYIRAIFFQSFNSGKTRGAFCLYHFRIKSFYFVLNVIVWCPSTLEIPEFQTIVHGVIQTIKPGPFSLCSREARLNPILTSDWSEK